MSLGRTIALLRREKRWTQAQLAQELGVHSHHVTRWETGKVRPRTETLNKIAEALGTTPKELGVEGEALALGVETRDPEMLELIRQIPKLEPTEQEALKVVMRAMVSRSQMKHVLASG